MYAYYITLLFHIKAQKRVFRVINIFINITHIILST